MSGTSSSSPSSSTAIIAPPKATTTTTGKRKRARAACDACHLRRVRCHYDLPPGVEPGEGDGCVTCKNKGIRCTRKAFTSAAGDGGAGAGDGTGKKMAKVPGVSARNEGALLGTELARALAGSLLQVQELMVQYPISSVLFPNFRRDFERLGGKPEALKTHAEQVLCACFVALGARGSNHSAILGGSVPTLDAHWGRNDIMKFGPRRESICNSLAERAIQMGDDGGYMRKASVENLVCLLMLESVANQSDHTCKSGRPYLISAASHLRHLLNTNTIPQSQESIVLHFLSPFIFARDAYTSLSSSDFLSLSPDDITQLFPPNLSFPPSLFVPSGRHLQHISTSSDILQVYNGVMALNIRVAVLIRSLVKEWASPLARARKGEEGRKLKSFWQGVIDTRLDVESVREGWENVHGKGAISKEKKKDGRAYFLSFEAQIARAIFIAHKVLEDRIASQREEIMGRPRQTEGK
ncbi:hypothetical protein BT69DRAFT_219677 [Atractiella rhizophila]|nr:hypothetical protein BT69DRAFT_219677 [Atractiella rhizophila]